MKPLLAFARTPAVLRLLLNLYGPFLGAGVRVRHIAADFSRIDVEMPLRWYNRNYVGTHFGGSLYSMTDPFLMLMLIRRLGPDYIVWDKAAKISFLRPGTGTMHARFEIDDAAIAAIRSATHTGEKHLPVWTVNVCSDDGELVASVEKTLYVKRKKPGH